MAKYDDDKQTLQETILKQLQGDWRVVYSELNGELTPVQDFSTIVTTHTGNTFTVKKNDKVLYEGRLSINVVAMPHRVSLIYTKAANEAFLGGPRVGIAQVTGNTLKTAFSPIGQDPPVNFNSYEDSDIVVSIYQRVKFEKGTGLSVARSKAIAQW